MNRVEWELAGKTNVDEVVDNTNKGLNGIEKNAKRVENAFTMSISSIFLRFLGPMALLQAAISWISTAIDESKQKAQEAMDLAAKGESMAVSAETTYLARKQRQAEANKKEQELAKAATEETTKSYIEDNNIRVMNKMGVMGWLKYGLATTGYASKQEDIQNAVRELAKEDMKKTDYSKMNPQGTDFKGTQGFSNVVGVGANPVLDTVTMQLEIQKQMLSQLELANSLQVSNEPDFTKRNNANYYGP